MYQKEADIVDEEFIRRKDTYNIKIGGEGGWDYINSTGKNHLHDNRENSIKNLELGTEAFLEKSAQ